MNAHPAGIDIVGINNREDGHSCKQHPVCSDFVKVTDKLFCTYTKQDFGRGMESCVKVHKVGAYSQKICHVGYLPHHLFMRRRNDIGHTYDDRTWLHVEEDLRTSSNVHERARSYRNYGIAYCHIITNDPHYSGLNPFEDRINVSPYASENEEE